ncbi:hypothetical protein SAMN05216267_104537 [Actinacidiphila rubida]|uniref:Uncharacterized protein n=1 Tax=Actinacidiphila rubida TaxID=310780 RepID=A0A1H8STA4_9ACTN|nr:hypothetical protein [Actinacidiphila rubida]SEO81716.1 hypothetical protein SAMN05216267_104537 [Actinacidiphila rubida]
MSAFHVIQYRIRPEAVAENSRLVSEVYGQLADLRPPSFRYATLLVGGHAFLHLAVTEGDGPAPLPGLPAFQEFQRELGTRVCAPPVREDAVIVGDYGLL